MKVADSSYKLSGFGRPFGCQIYLNESTHLYTYEIWRADCVGIKYSLHNPNTEFFFKQAAIENAKLFVLAHEEKLIEKYDKIIQSLKPV